MALVIAAFALGAAPQPSGKQPAPNNQTAGKAQKPAPPVAAPAPKEPVESAAYKQPCRNTPGDRQSDLCAQWEAADAARDAAWWAMFAAFVAIIGTVGLWAQIYLTRKAVEDTSEATEAMRESNVIARENMQRQLRAYITVEPCGINAPEDGMMRAPLLVENVGETPAHKVMSFSKFAVSPNPRDFDPSKLEGTDAWLQGEINDATIGRGVTRYLFPYARYDFAKDHMPAIDKKEAALIHFGYVTYEDVFGEIHRSNFAFYHWGEELTDVDSLRCRFGNTAD